MVNINNCHLDARVLQIVKLFVLPELVKVLSVVKEGELSQKFSKMISVKRFLLDKCLFQLIIYPDPAPLLHPETWKAYRTMGFLVREERDHWMVRYEEFIFILFSLYSFL